MPISQISSTDRALTQVSIEAGTVRGKYIATDVLPTLQVPSMTAYIEAFDAEFDTKRAMDSLKTPGSEAKTADFGISRPVVYKCIDHAFVDYVPDENFGGVGTEQTSYKALEDETENLTERIMLDREVRLVALLAASLTSGNTSSPGTKWSNAASGTPIADIKTKISLIELNSGVSPNFIGLDIATLRAIGQTAEYKAYTQYSMVPSDSILQDTLAGILGISKISTAMAQVNGSAQGQTASLARIWSDNVILAYVEPPRRKTAGLGVHAVWNSGHPEGAGGLVDGVRVKTWREERRSSYGVQVSNYYDQVILNANSGHWFSDVL